MGTVSYGLLWVFSRLPQLFEYLASNEHSISSSRYSAVNHSVPARLANLLLRQPIMNRCSNMDPQLRCPSQRDEHGDVHQRTLLEIKSRSSVAGETNLRDVLGARLREDVIPLLGGQSAEQYQSQ